MKFTTLLIAGIFAVFSLNAFHANQSAVNESHMSKIEAKGGEKTSFKVYGSCGMCEDRIENTANSIVGVSNAKWDIKKQMLTITYDPEKVDLMNVHKALAAVGHDTEKAKAKDKTYESLPACCKYRK